MQPLLEFTDKFEQSRQYAYTVGGAGTAKKSDNHRIITPSNQVPRTQISCSHCRVPLCRECFWKFIPVTLSRGCLIAGLPLILAERVEHHYKSMGWSLFYEIT